MDYSLLDRDAEIKQALAQAAALRKGAVAPQGQMVGNGQFQHYVAPHWSQQLSPVLDKALAGYETNRANTMAREQRAAQEAEMEAAFRDMPKGTPEVPAVPASMETYAAEEGPALRYNPGSPAVPAKEPTTDDWAKFYMRLNKNNLTKTFAAKGLEDALLKDPDKALDRKVKQAQVDMMGSIAAGKNETNLQIQKLKSMDFNQRTEALVQMGLDRNAATIAAAKIGAESRENVAKTNLEGVLDRNAKTLQAAQDKIKNGNGGKISDKQSAALAEASQGVALLQKQIDEFNEQKGNLFGTINDLGIQGAENYWGNKIAKGMGAGAEADKYVKAGNWWRNMATIDNLVRHSLFGSALTAGELKAWGQQSFNRNHTPEVAENLLKDRMQTAQKALDRITSMQSMTKAEAMAYARKEGIDYNKIAPLIEHAQPAPAAAPTGGGGGGGLPPGWSVTVTQ